MKILLSLTLIVFTAPFMFAQTQPCTQTVQDSPQFRGLKLGMTTTELLKTYRTQIEKSTGYEGELGETNFTILNMDAPAKLQGVEGIRGRIFNGRIHFITLIYGDGTYWSGIEDFQANVLSKLNIPAENWNVTKKINSANVACDGFRINVFVMSGNAVIDVTDTSVKAELEKQIEAKKKNIQP